MPRGPDPTPAELEFVYGLIAQGSTDQDIINEYARLDVEDCLVYGFRSDVRFVRKCRKQYAAAETVLTRRIERRLDPVLSQRRAAHFDDLARVVDLLVDGQSGVLVLRQSNVEGPNGDVLVSWDDRGPGEMERVALVHRLERNWNRLYEETTPLRVASLEAHVNAEFDLLASRGLQTAVREHPAELLQVLHLLCERRTFKGTCNVCQEWY